VRDAPKVEAAALAVAGAVENNRCPMTNITWVIDGRQLQQQFGFTTAVLNDFEAVGYGIPALDPKDLVVLNDAPVTPRAPKVVMGPGARACACCCCCAGARAGCVAAGTGQPPQSGARVAEHAARAHARSRCWCVCAAAQARASALRSWCGTPATTHTR
jgi:glucokinase